MHAFTENPRDIPREIPIIDTTDIVVAGGGPAGVMAAVAAARMGSKVTLLEKNGFLGGALTMHLPIQGLVDRDGRIIIKGLAEEFIDRMRKKGGANPVLTRSPQTNDALIIEPEAAKLVCQEMLLEAGVKLHLHTYLSDVHFSEDKADAAVRADGLIDGLIVQNKSGRQAIAGSFFIDATGDGDLAAMAGADFLVGAHEDGYPQSATLTFRVDGVDEEAMRRSILADPQLFNMYQPSYAALRSDSRYCFVGCSNLVKSARHDGFLMPFDKVILCSLMQKGSMLVNMTHVYNVLCHKAEELTRAELEARAQIPIMLNFLRQYMPGFEQAELTCSSSEVGVRETRRIIGEYTLTVEDLRTGRMPEDVIALSGYPVDIHSPDGKSVNLEHVPRYGIPFRTLIPKHLNNVLVAGRSLSATHEALASVRVMAPCMAMGQAAGTAAAMTLKEGILIRNISIPALQQQLRNQGAILGV